MGTEERLMSFYDQLPASRRQPYGRIINLYRAGRVQDAVSDARVWFDTARQQYESKGNDFWATDFAAAGCLLNILMDAIMPPRRPTMPSPAALASTAAILNQN